MKNSKKREESTKYTIIVVILVVVCIPLIYSQLKQRKEVGSGQENGMISQKEDVHEVDSIPRIQKEDLEDDDILLDEEFYCNERKNGNEEDIEKPHEVVYKKVGETDMLRCVFSIGEFQNGKELTSDQYIDTAALLLYILNKDERRTFYTEDEVRNIVYSIFNVKLSECASTKYMDYTGEGYKLSQKVEDINKKIKVIERDGAAGNTYITFSVDGKKYIAQIATNTVTNEKYVQSIKKIL